MSTSNSTVNAMMIIISLMEIVPLVDKTVATATWLDVLSAISDSGSTIPKLSVSTSVQLVQYTILKITVEVVLSTNTNMILST